MHDHFRLLLDSIATSPSSSSGYQPGAPLPLDYDRRSRSPELESSAHEAIRQLEATQQRLKQLFGGDEIVVDRRIRLAATTPFVVEFGTTVGREVSTAWCASERKGRYSHVVCSAWAAVDGGLSGYGFAHRLPCRLTLSKSMSDFHRAEQTLRAESNAHGLHHLFNAVAPRRRLDILVRGSLQAEPADSRRMFVCS